VFSNSSGFAKALVVILGLLSRRFELPDHNRQHAPPMPVMMSMVCAMRVMCSDAVHTVPFVSTEGLFIQDDVAHVNCVRAVVS